MSQDCKVKIAMMTRAELNAHAYQLEQEQEQYETELTKEREANKKLREGLEWYADPKTWQLGVTITLGSAYPHPEPIKLDKGKIARSILEGNEPNEGTHNQGSLD